MSKREKEIEAMILNYLGKNPGAEDTLEGITKWWLEMKRIEASVEEVANALEVLLQKGLIKIIKVKDGTNIYKIKNLK